MSVHREVSPKGAVSFRVKWRAGGRQRSKQFSAEKHGGERKAERLAIKHDTNVHEQLALTGVVVEHRGVDVLSDSWLGWWDDGSPSWTDETQEAYASAMDRHILPRLGHVQLAAIRPSTVEQWIRELQRAGVGPSAIAKATTVLSSVLSHAVRDDQIPSNPVHAARKAAAPRERDPLKITPLQVETIRAAMIERGWHGDATLVSLLAYAGLRPESEGIVLDWRHVGGQVLQIEPIRKRGAHRRHVRLLAPLADDLKAWRRRSGRLSGLVAPFGAGGVSVAGDAWSASNWNYWRKNRWKAIVDPDPKNPDDPRPDPHGLKLAGAVPRDLRGSFASLLIHEGRTVLDVADQLGHKPSTCLDVYAGIFADFDPVQRTPAIDAITEARRNITAKNNGAAKQNVRHSPRRAS